MVDSGQTGFVSADRREKLPIWGVFATTFRVFGRAPVPFLLMALLTQLPVIARLVISAPASPKFTLGSGIVLVANLAVMFFVQSAITVLAVRLASGETASLGEAAGIGARRYLPMLGTFLLVMLAVYGGLILLIVPGIIWAAMFAVAIPVCTLEFLGPIASMKRSSGLTRGSRWRILGIYVLFFVPLLAASLVVTFLVAQRGHFLESQWISVAIQLLWVPLATIFSAAIYIELRRLKEDIGIVRVFD